MKAIDLTGSTFGRLAVVQREQNTARGGTKWRCLCACGVVAIVGGSELRRGHTKSCGCLHSEVTRQRLTKHGSAARARKTAEYEIWGGIIKRCENPRNHAYARYGGRGIKVCAAWRADFTKFLADVGPRPSRDHSIDRINNDGDYEPGNVRWATRSEQARNRRPQARRSGRFA